MNERELIYHIRHYEKRLHKYDRKLRKAGERNQEKKVQAIREEMAHDRAAIRAFKTVKTLTEKDNWEG